MSTLVVKCPTGDRKDDKKVVGRIVDLVFERLTKLGAGGVWTIELYKKTGGGTQERLIFKRVFNSQISGFKPCLMYFVRPFDRDSSWLILVNAPPEPQEFEKVVRQEQDYQKISRVESLAQGKEVSLPSQDDTDDEEINLNPNQVRHARVTKHLEHGLELEIDGGHEGFIPLADLCDGKYDKKQLNKYPVGQKIRVVISAIQDDGQILCSTRLEGLVTTDVSRDTFTGIPNKDGSLGLVGFSCDPRRVCELIEWLAMVSVDLGKGEPKPIPSEETLDQITEYFISRYPGTTTVLRQAVATLLRHLCGPTTNMPYAVIEKKGDGCCLTDFAWGEVGGVDKIKHRKGDTRADMPAVPEIPAPLPLESTTVISSPAPTVSSGIKNIINEVAEKEKISHDQATVVVHSAVKKMYDAEHDPSVDEMTTYLGKAIRYAEIQAQIASLVREKAELDQWLADHAHLKEHVARLKELMPAK